MLVYAQMWGLQRSYVECEQSICFYINVHLLGPFFLPHYQVSISISQSCTAFICNRLLAHPSLDVYQHLSI